MTYRRSFALAFVTFSVACGGNGGSGELGTVGNEPPEFNEEAPVTNGSEPPVDSFGSTPNDTDQAPFNPEAPPVGTSPGGVVSPSACQEICSALVAAGCGDDPGTCVTECSNPDPEDAACWSETIALLDCMVHAPNFACVDGEFRIDVEFIELNCPNEAAASFQCQEQNPDPPDPPDPPNPDPNACTLAGDSCAGCTEVCSACLCLNAADPTLCTDSCS